MKRDHELIERILLIVEETAIEKPPALDGLAESKVLREHLILMRESGLIDVQINDFVGGNWDYFGLRLTSHGHDACDRVRQRR